MCQACSRNQGYNIEPQNVNVGIGMRADNE